MSYPIKRTKQIDAQLKQLRCIMKDGTFHTAGITVTLGVGKDSEDDLQMEFGVHSDCARILSTLETALLEARAHMIRLARVDLAEVSEFLTAQSND